MDKKCPRCNKIFSHKRNKYCSAECSKVIPDERRKRISDKRKRYLLENKELHPWKRKEKFKSIPCERVKEFLNNRGIKFVEEWNPVEDRNYSIDIAFPDIKLGIEINGNQHYANDGKLNEYYQIRHDIITAAGWTLLELHYSIAFNLEKLLSIIEIKEQPDYTEFFRIVEEKRNTKLLNLPKDRGVKIREKRDAKWESYKDKVINSNINFGKFGWVNEVAKILDISPQKVNEWMKRYLPEFYENYCFKRKSITRH